MCYFLLLALFTLMSFEVNVRQVVFVTDNTNVQKKSFMVVKSFTLLDCFINWKRKARDRKENFWWLLHRSCLWLCRYSLVLFFFLSWSWDPDSAQRTVCMCNALGRTTGGGLELWGTGTRALSCSSTLSVSDKVTWSWRSGGYDRAFVSFCLVTRRPFLFVLFKYSFLPVWPANSHQGTPVTVDWQWTANPGMHYWLVTDEYE